LSPTDNTTVLSFRQYCNNIWELPRGFDESLCKEWKCPRGQYQCLSGHCTPVEIGLKNYIDDWNCPDASDWFDLLRISQLSEHNIEFLGLSKLEEIKTNRITENNAYYNESSPTSCNYATEYPCLLANVDDPLNFIINRPCVNMTQIGDGVIDCYGGLDERNLLTCGRNIHDKRGFDFHCDDQQCIPYHLHCKERCSNKADNLLCEQLPTLWNSILPNVTRRWVCAASFEGSERDIMKDKWFYCDKGLERK
jgi:hypothetical protein